MRNKEYLIALIKSASRHIGMEDGKYDDHIISDIQSYINEIKDGYGLGSSEGYGLG